MMLWLCLGTVVLILSPALAASDLGLAIAPGSNSSRDADPLRDWLVGLKIPVPVNITGDMPMDMGQFTVLGGYCTGVEVGRIEAEDLGSGQILEIGLRIAGLGITCVVDGYSEGEIQINITFKDSALNATLQIHPWTDDFGGDLPLPMGQLNLTRCEAGLAVTSMKSEGVGFLAETLFWLGDDVVELVGMAINEPVCEAMKDFVEVNATAVLSSYAMLVSPLLLPPFPESVPEPLRAVQDWTEYPPVGVVKALLSERFAPFADKLINIIDVTDFDSELASEEGVRLVLSRLFIEGRGDQHAPSLMVGAHESSLNLTVDLAGMAIKASLDLDVSLLEQAGFSQRIDVTVGLQRAAVGFRAMFDEAALDALELDKTMSSPRCLAQLTDGTTDPTEDALAIEEFQVQMRPLLEIDCPGPLAADGAHLINTIVGALYNGYLPTVNALVNGALGLSRFQLDELLWKKINDSPPCSGEGMFPELSKTQVYLFWSAFVVIGLLGVPAAVLAHLFWKRAPPGSRHKAADCEQDPPAEPAATSDMRLSASKPMSLACEPCVPPALAVYYPFAVLAVMALFLYADLDIGTTVTMVMAADGAAAEIGPLFSFSLISTIAHAWSSGAYFIAVLTVISSAIWPMAKLCLLLQAWLVPPRCCSLWRRGKILNGLDAWGKYSFLDSWFLVVTLSAFALEWDSLGSASLKIQTTPQTAFYAYFLATVLSLVLGHIASECHHRCAEQRALAAAKATDLESSNAVGDSKGSTSVQAAGQEPLHKFAASQTERAVVMGVLCATVMVGLLGTFLVSFSFEVSGIFTEFLFGENVQRSYSLFSVGMSVASHRYNDTGLIALEVGFILLAVVVPAVLFELLVCLWCVPMQLKRQRSLLHFCRLLDAWSCLDVAALVLAIACFEFGRMAEWLVYEGNFGAPCSMVKNITKEECMKIELHALPALTALFLAGVLLLVVPKVCLRRFARALQRRSESAVTVSQPKMACSS